MLTLQSGAIVASLELLPNQSNVHICQPGCLTKDTTYHT